MDEPYEGREQSLVKHHMLEHYLEKLAYKVGFSFPGLTLNYIDGFAGPWESKTADLRDTSPALALRTLLAVRERLAAIGRPMAVRAFFVSPSEDGAQQLRDLKPRFPEAQIVITQKRFEDALDEAKSFSTEGRIPFTLIFIDPTGWSGFGLRHITPLLRSGRTEVLINFMTSFISRFVDTGDPRYEPSFVSLFGDGRYRAAWQGLQGLDREDRIVEEYCDRVAQAGGFEHSVSAVILDPKKDRTHYHLVYATHSDEGLVTFRSIERQSIDLQRKLRAQTQQRSRIEKTGQGALFPASTLVARAYEDELRDRYRAAAYAAMDSLVERDGVVPWDTLVTTALRVPLTSEAEVKEWLDERRRAGRVEPVGLGERERVPKRRMGHHVRSKTSAR